MIEHVSESLPEQGKVFIGKACSLFFIIRQTGRVIIDAGPAGLTAAIYLARFRREFCVIDAGASRAASIPLSHNYPGLPEGISGPELLGRLRAQAERYGAVINRGNVERLKKDADAGFTVFLPTGSVRAKRVLLASGSEDIEPELPGLAVGRGLVR
jgi:thioredoxin reductase (NADPH)